MEGVPPSDEERAAGRFEIGYACLFCGEPIPEDAPDFCELTVAAPAGVAAFTCHAGCLRSSAKHPEYFPDLLTPAEPPIGYEPPSEELLEAWSELAEVLAQINEAELDGPAEVRSFMRAIEEAAVEHGIVIEREGEDPDDER